MKTFNDLIRETMLDIVSLIPGLKPVKIGASTTTYL
jgi:hypothetical protein